MGEVQGAGRVQDMRRTWVGSVQGRAAPGRVR
jgi:hypothetical protein